MMSGGRGQASRPVRADSISRDPLPHCVRRAVEPARPKTPVPGTGAATSYATSACERLTGFEPATFDLASRRSDLLSYNRMERTTGFEPATPTLGTSCSTC
jgi:hypothetical protein